MLGIKIFLILIFSFFAAHGCLRILERRRNAIVPNLSVFVETNGEGKGRVHLTVNIPALKQSDDSVKLLLGIKDAILKGLEKNEKETNDE